MDYSAELNNIKERYERLKAYYHNEKGKQEQLVEQKVKLQELLRKTEDNIDTIEKTRILLQKLSEYAREQARVKIEALVTNCLQYIFDSSIEFKIEINEVRGKPEAEFFVISHANGEAIKTKPQEARGGGVVDIISLALRIAMLECSSLDVRGPIILDEPAKHVSDEFIIQVAEFLKQVSIMFDRQVVMVTHNRHLSEIAEKWYRIEMKDGISRTAFDS